MLKVFNPTVIKVALHFNDFKQLAFVLLLLVSSVYEANAGNKTWTNGGGTNNWSDASNWSGGLPGTGDVAIFGSTYRSNCNINTQINVSGITIQSGYTGTITQGTGDSVIVTSNYSQSAGTFTGRSSIIRVKGSLSISAGTFTSTSGTLYVGTNFTVSSGATFTHNSGTIYFDQATTATITFPTGTMDFNNVTFNSSAGKNIATNDTMVINGTLSLLQNQVKGGVIRMVSGSSLTQNASFTGGTSQLELKAALTINPTTTNFLGLILNHASAVVNAPSSSISFNAPVYINSGTFNGGSNSITFNDNFSQTGGSFTATSGTMSFDKNLTYTAGTFSTNNGTVAFTSANNTTFNTGGKLTFKNATLNKTSSSVILYIGASDTLKTSGTLTLTKGTTNGGYLQPLGNNGLSIGAGYNGGTSVMLITAANSFTIAAGVTVPTLILNNALASVSLSSGTSPIFTGPLTIYDGTFDGSSSTWNMGQNINIQGGTFTSTSDVLTYSNATLTIANGATFNHNSGTVIFSKATGGITIDNSLKVSMYNVTFDLNDADPNAARLVIKAGDTIIVAGSLTLQAGAIDSGVVELQGDLTDLGGFNGGTGQISIANGSGSRSIYLMSAVQPALNIDDASASVFAPSTQSLTVSGSFNLNNGEFLPDAYPIIFSSSYTQNGGTFWNGVQKITMLADMNVNNGTFYATSDTLELDGQNMALGASATFNHNNGIAYFNSANNNTTITSTSKLQLYNLIISLSNAASNLSQLIIASGDTVQSIGALILQSGSLYNGVLQISGDLTDQGVFKGGTGTFYFSPSPSVRNLYLMSALQPNIVINDTSLSLNTPTDKAVTFTGTFKLINGDFFPYSYHAYPITFNGAFTQTNGTFWNGAAKETMKANATISGGTFIATSDTLEFSNSSTLTIQSPTVFTHNNGTIAFTGGANTVLSYNAGTLALNSLNINYTSAELRPNCPLSLAGNLTIGSSAVLNMANSSVNVSLAGDLNDLNPSQGLVYGSQSVTLNGSSSQNINGSVGEENFYNLVLSNTSGGIHTVNTDVRINNQLSLTPSSNAKFFLGGNNITLSSSANISGGSSSEFVVTDGIGSLRQENIGSSGRSGNIFFPVGNTSTKYTPVTLQNTGTNDRFDVRVTTGVLSNGTTGSPTYTNALNQTYFVEEGTPGGSNVTLTIQWNASDEFTGFDRTNCGIRHYTGGQWIKEGTDGVASGSGPYLLTASGITTFSPFDGGTDGGGSLPVELASFSGQLNNNATVTLDWITEVEINNKYFTIERSTDGIKFSELGRQDGAGNSTIEHTYSMIDFRPTIGTNYYRLKQTDFNGGFKYVGNIVDINIGKDANSTVLIYPNPLEGSQLTIDVTGASNNVISIIELTDVSGKIVYHNTLTGSSNKITLPTTLSQGIYIAQVTSGNFVSQQKLLIK